MAKCILTRRCAFRMLSLPLILGKGSLINIYDDRQSNISNQDACTGNFSCSIGVNLSGAEFGNIPGCYGIDYIYPHPGEFDYFSRIGMSLVRLPFRWERLQRSLNSEFDDAELYRIMSALNAAMTYNLSVIIDLHNFGRYFGAVVGTDAVPALAFQAFWVRLASILRNHPAIWGYGIMNEPHDMGDPNIWPTTAQQVINGIRSVDMQTRILISGDNWSQAQHWQTHNDELDLIDPANNIFYEAHQYFDHNGSGTYLGTYDQEGAHPMIGAERIVPFSNWLSRRNARGFIGEFGVPDDDPRWLAVLRNFLMALQEKQLPAAYWAAGPRWGRYRLSIEPVNGEDRPQTGTLIEAAQRCR